MFELTIGKNEYLSDRNVAFNVDVLNYVSSGNVVDMRVPIRVCSGYYIDKKLREPDCGVAEVLNSLSNSGKLLLPILIFDSTHISRELTEVEQHNRDALERFLKIEIKNPELKLGKIYEEVIRFNEALKLLKNKDKVNGMLPVPVESVAFIEMYDTEGDFILSQEAEFIDTWTAINGNRFNIYRLW